MASGYDRAVSAGGTTPLPTAPDAAFGTQVAGAVADAGGQLSAEHQRAQQLRREQAQDQQSVDWADRFATVQTGLSQSVADLRGSAAPGAAGHVAAVASDFDDRIAPALDGISNPVVRRTAQMQIASTRAALLDREGLWAAGERVSNLKATATNAASTMANNARGLDSPLDVHGVETQANAMIDTLAGINADDKTAMKRATSQQIYSSWLEGLSERTPAKALAVLDHGALNDVLEPKQIEALRSYASTQQNRMDAEARAQMALGKSQAEQSISLLKAKISDGIVVPDGELAQGQAAAVQYGLVDKSYDVAVTRQRQAVNLETQSWTPAQYQAEEQRLAALGPKASEADQVRLDQIRAIAPKRIAQFHDDPGGYAAANGTPPPAIDDATGMAARAQWRAGVQAATGTWTPTLSKEEAAPWIEKVQHGTPADRLETAQYVNSWGAEAPNLLRQIEPNRDSAFAQAVTLGSISTASMRDALAGPDALKAAGGEDRVFHVDPNNPQQHDGAGNPLTPASLFGQGAAQALAGRGAGFGAGVMENARNIYASTAQKNGWTVFHPGEFQRSIQRAAGGREVNGEWIGGFGWRNGVTVLLPSTMSERDFDRTISRATPEQLFHAGGNSGPVYADGSSLTAGALKALVPVAIGGGHYVFKSGNSYVSAKKGGWYVLDIAKLPR